MSPRTVQEYAPSDLTREALAIADRYVERAIWHGDRCTWIHRDLQEPPDPLGRGPRAETLNAGIYDGLAGVAWFLAQSHLASEDPDHARTARGAILQALRLVRRGVPETEQPVWVGPASPSFYSGGLGVAWLGLRIAQRLQDQSLAIEARSLLRTYCDRQPVGAVNDLMGGAAGAILALLDLHARGESGALEYATFLGDHLLETQVETEAGAAWPWSNRGVPGAPLTGYSHGASGYAHALFALGRTTGEARYTDAARDAVRYERALFDAEARNWPDLRELDAHASDEPSFMSAWCHGAPGIGLSRVLLRADLDAEADREVRDALTTTLEHLEVTGAVPDWSFTACHGLSGNIECALEMARALGEDAVVERLHAMVDQRITRYGTANPAHAVPGLNDWPTGRPGYSELGLLKGLAGTGYFLLRLGSGGTIPTFLSPGRFDASDPQTPTPDEPHGGIP